MSLPLPNAVESGGDLVSTMKAINALTNLKHQTRINKAKADLAPWTESANAMSKLAYANLMGPQFISKLLANPGFVGNTPDDQLQFLREMVTKAGTGQGSGNSLTSMPQYTGVGQPSTNSFSNRIKNAYHAFIGGGTNNSNSNALNTENSSNSDVYGSSDNLPIEFKALNAWKKSPEGIKKTREQGNNYMPDEKELMDWYRSQTQNSPYSDPGRAASTSAYDTFPGRRENKNSYSKNTGEYLGTIKQGEEEGKYRAEAERDIGKAQLALSGSGAAQDELINIIKNPIWQHARDTFPGFQKQQLSILKVTGSPEFRKLAGEYSSATQAMIASQVAGMGNKHLVREYDLAEKQKINDSDTVESSEGKLTNAKNLHDIAVQKNKIIKNLLKQGIDEAEAVEIANKKVDINKVRKATDKLLERKIKIKNNKTGETREITVKEAQKLGVPNV